MPKTSLLILILATISFSQVQSLPQSTLSQMIQEGTSFDFVLIDVRSAAEASNVIGNDKCIPYNLPWPDNFKQNCTKLDTSQHIILYCASGSRAGSAANYLFSLGYNHVYTAGGFGTWTGPKLTSDFILPADSLPKPSMVADQTGVISLHASRSRIQTAPTLKIIPCRSQSTFAVVNLRGQVILTRWKIAAAPYILGR